MTEYVANPVLVADLADELLTTAMAALDDPPERTLVSHGEPAYDCAQLTVHVVRLQPKPGVPNGSERCTVYPTLRLAVTLLRCVTAVEEGSDPIPSAETLHAENMALAEDGWRLWKHLTGAWARGELPGELGCGVVRWGALEPRGPIGGLAGWRIEIEYEL